MNLHLPSRDAYGYLSSGSPEYNRLSALFRSAVKGANFFTPKFLGYVDIPNGVAEISEGSQPFASLSNEKMYGVTVVINGEKSSEKSTCLNSYSEVVDYIKSLQS